MLIQEIMTRDVAVVAPKATIQQAAKQMKDLDVGSLPVCEGDRLEGMLTDRDITVVATAEGMDPSHTPVSEIMTPDVVYCYEDQPIEEAAVLMGDKKVRRLAVLNRNKRLVGIVSIGDLAEKSEDELLIGEVLEKVSAPAGSGRPDAPPSIQPPDIPTETHL
jgi:CBS domain-containing protein